MKTLLDKIALFREKRDWHLHDTASNLSKSIVVEAAELLEHFQWSEEGFDKDKVEAELADVLMYALAMCLHLELDPQTIIEKKMLDVALRYPEKDA